MLTRLIAGTGVVALTAVLTVSLAQAGPITQRAAHQRARIHQGVASGELTPVEAHHLRRQQGHIAYLRQEALRNGHIGPREYALINGAQDHASRTIYRLKHNGRERPAGQE